MNFLDLNQQLATKKLAVDQKAFVLDFEQSEYQCMQIAKDIFPFVKSACIRDSWEGFAGHMWQASPCLLENQRILY